MRKYLIVILLFCASTSFGQVYFDHGPKIGISSNLFWQKHSKMVFSPVLGYWGQLQFNPYLSFLADAHFQRTGSVPNKAFIPGYSTYGSYIKSTNISAYTNKISVPLQLRVSPFRSEQLRPSLHVGLTTNALLGGKYDVIESYLTEDDTKVIDRYSGKTVVIDYYDTREIKVLFQFNFGVDMEVAGGFFFGFDAHLGSYTHLRLPINHPGYVYGVRNLNNDFELSLRYKLND